MLVIEAKLKGTKLQYSKLDEAIRTAQFVRNKCLKYWEENEKISRNDLQKYCAVLAANAEYPWVAKLNSQARQSLVSIHSMASIFCQNPQRCLSCSSTT